MIKQCHISDSLKHFKEGFFSRWNLVDYRDTHEPALFVGCYGSDYITINNHRGFKLILFGGADIPNILRLKINPYTHIVVDEFTYKHSMSKYYGFVKKFVRVPWKDYSEFTPMPLGDKIYCYQSMDSPGCRAKYRYDILERVIEYFGRERVLIGYQGNTIKTMIDEYYSRSFVNLQLNPIAGFTTTLEMAHMGRLSVSNYEAPFCWYWETADDVINIITSIDEMRLVADPKGFLHDSSDWLEENYWL